MKNIQQGDQYAIPIKICMGETIATPDNVNDVRIKVGSIMQEYSAGQLTFDDDYWKFTLTEDMSREIDDGYVTIQAAVKIGNDYVYSATQSVSVGFSIIGDDWNYEN